MQELNLSVIEVTFNSDANDSRSKNWPRSIRWLKHRCCQSLFSSHIHFRWGWSWGGWGWGEWNDKPFLNTILVGEPCSVIAIYEERLVDARSTARLIEHMNTVCKVSKLRYICSLCNKHKYIICKSYTKITKINLSAFVSRLFHEDFDWRDLKLSIERSTTCDSRKCESDHIVSNMNK